MVLLSIFIISCQKNEKYDQNYLLEYNKDKLIEVGKILYNKNCRECHGNINAYGNIIRNNNYDFIFFKNYLTKQDSLIRHGNKEALKLKEIYNIKYIHKFNLNDNELKSLKLYLGK